MVFGCLLRPRPTTCCASHQRPGVEACRRGWPKHLPMGLYTGSGARRGRVHGCSAEQKGNANCCDSAAAPAKLLKQEECAVTAVSNSSSEQLLDSNRGCQESGQASWDAVGGEGSLTGLLRGLKHQQVEVDAAGLLVDVIDIPQSPDTIVLGVTAMNGNDKNPLTASLGTKQAVQTDPSSWDAISSEASITGIVDAIISPQVSSPAEADSLEFAGDADTDTTLTAEPGSCNSSSNPQEQDPCANGNNNGTPIGNAANNTTSSTDQRHIATLQSSIKAPVVGSFNSIDDAEQTQGELNAAQATPDHLRFEGAKQPIWWPPPEFSSLCGLAVAVMITGISNVFLCKPMTVRYSGQRIVKQCSSCCASSAVQAQHLQYLQRQPQLFLPALPLPLRQHLEVDQLPPPNYKVPSLVSLPSVQPHDDGLAAAAVAAQEWIYSRVAYHLQQLATANLTTKFLALWAVAMPFILLFGSLYRLAAQTTLSAAMYKVYALLYRVPGVGIAKEDNNYAYLVANMAFLVGTFTFAAIVGIVSDEIKTGIKNSRSGNYNMRLAGHILLLNWNSSSTALLRQIAMAYTEGGMFGNGAPWPWSNRPPVVVLADKRKAAMDEAVHEMLRDRGLKLEVHTREGNPFKLSDLRKVAAGKASTIIVQHPDSASTPQNAEAIKASVAMCLTALGPQVDQQRVVVQMTGPAPSEHSVLKSLGASKHLVGRTDIQSLQLPDSQLMHRLVVQTAAQPGILTCWLDILALANNSAQFYTADLPDLLAQKPYMEVRRAFEHAVLCGYRAPGGVVALNPPETELVSAGSKLVFLGRGGSPQLLVTPHTPLYDTAAAAAAERLRRERTYKSKARNILVADWPLSSIPELMEGFSMFTPSNSVITFTITGQAPEAWSTRLGSCRFNFVSSDHPTCVKTLLEAGIKSVDAVVLGPGCAPSGPDMETDARILAAVLQVQDAVLTSRRRDAPHLVAPIRRYATSKLASQYLEVLAAEHSAASNTAICGAAAAAPPGPACHAATAASSSTASASAATAQTGIPSATSAAASPASVPTSGPATAPATAAAAASKPSGGVSSLLSMLPLVGSIGGSSSGGSSSSSSSATPANSLLPAAVICEPEFLVPTDVTSALMTQVVSEPAYSDIMKALLFTSDGMELYLRNPASFNIPTGVPLSFAEVEEAVRLTRQTALGYIRSNSAGQQSVNPSSSKAVKASKLQQQRKAVLGPSASHVVTFSEGDRVVVLAQDYAAASLS